MEKKSLLQKPIVILPLAVLSTLLWGSAHPVVKIGYQIFGIGENAVFDKLLFAGVRFALAGVLVLAASWMVQRRFPLPQKAAVRDIAALGFVQTAVQYLFFYIGLSHTTAMKSAIINATAALMAILLAHFVYKDDRLTLRKGTGCLLGFVGVVLINLGDGFGGGFAWNGEGFLILAAASFAVGSIMSKQAAAKEDSMVVTGWQLLIGGMVLVIVGFLGGAKLTVPSAQAFWLLIYLALLSSVAFTLWTVLLKNNSVGKISVYNFLTPVFGVLLSVMLLGEAFDWKIMLALAAVCTGILIVNLPQKSEGKG